MYLKKTFTGQYTKWDSFTPRKYKVSLIRTLAFRCFRICSSPSLLRSCLNELRELLLQSGYPSEVINYNINDVLTSQRNRTKNPTTTAPKKEIILVVPYLGVQSKIITKQLKTCINKLSKAFIASSLFFPTKIGSTVPKCQKLCVRLVVETARISTLEKQNVVHE